MPNIPDKLVIKKNKELQNTLYGVATLVFIGGLIALINGAGGGFVVMVLGYLIGWGASKIKTTKTFQGGAGLYK